MKSIFEKYKGFMFGVVVGAVIFGGLTQFALLG